MNISQAVETRISCRAFLDKEVAPQILRDLIKKACRAPSGGNLQPWHVHILGKSAVDELRSLIAKKMADGVRGEKADYSCLSI